MNSFSIYYFFGKVVVTAALGGLVILHGFKATSVSSAGSNQHGTKQGRRCNHAIWSFFDFESLSCGCSKKDSPHQYFLFHSGHAAKPMYLRPLYSEKWLYIQGFTISSAGCAVWREVSRRELFAKIFFCTCTSDSTLAAITQDSWTQVKIGTKNDLKSDNFAALNAPFYDHGAINLAQNCVWCTVVI